MSKIELERAPSAARLKELGVVNWPTWSKEVARFPWTYSEAETCYFLDGDVIVTPAGGAPVRIGKGDLVTFPAGMSCEWDIRAAVRKHYRFG